LALGNVGQGYPPATFVLPTMLGQPVLTVIFAIPLLSEGLSYRQIAGGLPVIAGVYIVHRSHLQAPG
jgi:drug/metabolite transporter (DMT)-like permease